MRTARLTLEDFADPADPERLIARPARAWEAERAAARAEGHAAGLAEAAAAAASRAADAQAALAEALADIGMTHEAMRAHLLRALDPLLRAVAGVLVPGLAARGLADHLVAEIAGAAARLTGAPLTVRVAPAEVGALRAALAAAVPRPPEVVAEPGRLPGTARISGLAAAREIDPARAAARIAALIEGFLDDAAARAATAPEPAKETRHG